MSARGSAVRRRVAFALAVSLSLVAMAPASSLGASEIPEGNSGLDQYIESVPSAEGDRAPSGVKRPNRSAQGGKAGATGSQGEALDSSSTSGAKGAKRERGQRRRKAARGEAGESASSAVSSAVFDSGDPTIPVLAGSLLLLTGAAAGVAIRRRRS
jgi:hypothetical protein